MSFFSTLYKSDQDTYCPYYVQGCFPQIDQLCLANLATPIDNEEIRQAVFQMSPLKAPGVDGFPAGFYQSQWHIVGDSFCAGIKEVFTSHCIPREVNKTLFILIPKTKHPISFKMYRPIKFIVNRLQVLLLDLVGPHQTSFVPGRHITKTSSLFIL